MWSTCFLGLKKFWGFSNFLKISFIFRTISEKNWEDNTHFPYTPHPKLSINILYWYRNFVTTSVVQSLSLVWLFATPLTAACQASLSFTISWSLLKLMSIELVMPSNHLILCHHLLVLPSIVPRITVFF